MPASHNNHAQSFYQRHRTLIWGATATAVGLYAAYRATAAGDKPGISRPPSSLARLKKTLEDYSSTLTCLGDTAALVSSDLRAFLSSDSDELPQSLRQLSKLAQAPELQESLSTAVASVVRGVAGSWVFSTQLTDDSPVGGINGTPLVDTLLEAALSERGKSLLGMAVGVATRNATTAFCEFLERRMDAAQPQQSGGSGSLGSLQDVMALFGSEQGERLLSLLITKSIRTAVGTYVESTTGYNFYDDMLSAIAKTDHRQALSDIMCRVTAAFCKEVATAYRRANAGASSSAGGRRAGASAPAALDALVGRCTAAAAADAAADGSSVCSSSCNSSDIGIAAATPHDLMPPGTPPEATPSHGQRCAGAHLPSARHHHNHHDREQHLDSGAVHQHSLLLSGLSATSPSPAPVQTPSWLRQVVELARERDVRSLAVDVVMNASREATRGAVEGLMCSGSGRPGLVLSLGGLDAGVAGYKLCVLASVGLAMVMYAISPHTVVV